MHLGSLLEQTGHPKPTTTPSPHPRTNAPPPPMGGRTSSFRVRPLAKSKRTPRAGGGLSRRPPLPERAVTLAGSKEPLVERLPLPTAKRGAVPPSCRRPERRPALRSSANSNGVAIVRPEQPEADRLRIVTLRELLDRERVAERLRHLLGAEVHEAVVQPVARRTGRRSRPRTGRSRSRGAGRSGPRRRRGCRATRRGTAWPSPSTRCASPGGPGPTGSPTTARRAWPPSRARSPAGRACARRPRPARPPAARRGSGRRACRSPEAPHREVDVAVHDVGEASGDQPLDQRDHLGDVLGRLGLHVGRRDADRGHVRPVLGDVPLRDLVRGDAVRVGARMILSSTSVKLLDELTR